MLAATPMLAQSQNRQALNWFKVGLAEKDPGKKLAAYLKAVEIDPQFVEALYNIGIMFKQQQDYRRAELYLFKALSAKPEKTKNEVKLQILYELGMAYKKLGKANDAEEALGGAKGIAMEPAMKAAITFEIGRLFYDGGKYQAALVELREGRDIPGANQEQFNSLIQLAENAIELQRLDDAAEKAIAGGNWRVAKALFEQIRAKNPAYKDIDGKIAGLDAKINAEIKDTNLAALYDQAVKQMTEGDWEAAILGLENVLQQSDGNYKDAKTRMETARQQLAQKQLAEKLESDYAAGLAALRLRNWTRAILAFENVIEADKDYRDARKRLAEAQSNLERESKETIVARYYAEGVAAMNKNDFGAASAAFEKVRKINSDYRDVAALLVEIDQALQQKAANPPTATAAAPIDVEALYQEAVVAAERADWMQAVIGFEKVQLLQANYRDVIDRLAEARANLTLATNAESVAASASESNVAFYLGSAVALVAVPVLGVVAFSPATRARLHLFRGNYAAAVQIYESMLARHPNKVKLYPALANIYLLTGRHDENAMKVYKMILQLNLPTHNREEISSILAQNYLTEGRTDSDAIEVLESALKAEQRRAGQTYARERA
jgi:tetratricopeptide (TPR) repeat protein